MIDSRKFVYSKAAIARMRGVAVAMVERVEVWFNCIFVIIRGCRPKFYSKDSFRNHFVDWRKKQAENLQVQNNKTGFRVYNPEKSSIYTCEAFQEGIKCTCEDYNNQQKYLRKGVCKHGYAILKHLGFDRLSDYVDHHRWCS